VQIDFATPRRIGAVGLLQTRQDYAPNWARGLTMLEFGGGLVNTNNSVMTGRNRYWVLYEGTPTNVTSVRLTLAGSSSDQESAITEIDLWEYELIGTLIGADTTNFTDHGVTAGVDYAYHATAYDAVGESGLSGVAAIRAGDRDDTNTSDIVSDYRNGSFVPKPAKVAPPAAATNSVVDFGHGNYYAWTRMVIHQSHNGGAPQHHYRAACIEAAGGYTVGYNSLTAGGIDFYNQTNVALNTYCSTVFSRANDSGLATFGMGPKVGGSSGPLPDIWLVGDKVTLHLTTGENSLDHAEYEIHGMPIAEIGEVPAGTCQFGDSTAVDFTNYTYFVVAEDYAGNQSPALTGTFDIRLPRSGAAVMLR
jgi:hypothetical protein